MLRLALVGGLSKACLGGAAAWQVHAAAALAAHQHRATPQQHGSLFCPGTAAQEQAWRLFLPQQQPFSQHTQPPKQPPQQQQKQHKQESGSPPGSGGAAGSSSNSNSSKPSNSSTVPGSNGSPASSSSSSNGSSTNGGGASKQEPPHPAGSSKGRSRKVVYTGATTAADLTRRSTAAASAQQLELSSKQHKQPPGVQLLQQTPSAPQLTSSNGGGSSSSSATGSFPQSGAPATQRAQPEQLWEQEHKHYSREQQQQWKSQEKNYQKQPPQQQQYKITQYSKGVSTMLSLSAQPSGDYSLAKTKGPASAADLAAFGRMKAPKDGAAAAAKAAKEVPLLLRPLHPYYLRVKKSVQATFLPSGYPTSVGSNYLQYTLWQAVTNFATTANGVLASTFLLYSVGLGAGAIPTAGALNWVLKDGLGQMGTLLFGKAIAHNFDIHSKTWYFMSFLLLSTATGLEIATILVPHAFLVLGSCANMIKGLSWMAGGSTRSVFNLSFVRDNNIADITAKNTSQYIFASLFGTAAGVSCCAYIGQSAPLALLCFSGLAYTSMYSAYRTVKAIPLPTLNSTRLQLLAASYLKCVRITATDGFPGVLSYERHQGFLSYQQEYEVPEDEDDTCELELPSPLDMAELDNPLPWVVGDPRLMNPGIHVGSQLDRLVEGQPAMLVVVLNTFRYSRYLLVPERNAIHLVLHAEAQPRDMVQAYLQACILRKCLKTGHSLSPDNLPELRIILHDTLLAAENLTPPFMRALARQGWQTEKIVVEAHRRRARW